MSALADRLVTQLLRQRDREVELAAKQEAYASKVRDEEEVRKELEQQREKLEKVQAVVATLEKMNTESVARYTAVQEDDATQRQSISDDLKRQIAIADTLSKELAQREQQAHSRKDLLLKQQEIYDTHASSGREKFEELSTKRESEAASLTQKREENMRLVPELEERILSESKELAAAKAAQAALKAQVDEYLAQFAEIQSQLSAAKKVYESAATEKDRNLRALKTMESDLQMLRRRSSTSMTERDKEVAKVTALEEKMQTAKEQIRKLEAVTRMLEASK